MIEIQRHPLKAKLFLSYVTIVGWEYIVAFYLLSISKDLNAINIIYEATGILILAVAAYIMTLKDKISLKKILLREKIEDTDLNN